MDRGYMDRDVRRVQSHLDAGRKLVGVRAGADRISAVPVLFRLHAHEPRAAEADGHRPPAANATEPHPRNGLREPGGLA